MQTQVNTKTCYRRRNQSTRRKSLCGPPSHNDPLVSKVRVREYQKDPPSLIYPMYLNPLSSSSQRASPSHFLASYLDLAISSKLHLPINGFFLYFPHAPKLLSTLRLGEVSVQTKNLSRICNWRGKSRISNSQVYCQGFFSKSLSYNFVGNVSLYSMGKEIKKAQLKSSKQRVSWVTRKLSKSQSDSRNTAWQTTVLEDPGLTQE